MKDLLVPQASANAATNSHCDYHKDALLGFALDLPNDQLDTAMLQLQAAGQSLQQHNNNNNSNGGNSNSADFHQSLLHCVDLLPPIAAAALPVAAAPPSGVYRRSGAPAKSASQPMEQLLLDGYAFDADSELVNVANKDCDSLAKLAYNLWRIAKEDHIVIDRKRNEVVRTDAATNQKTIYRCMDPLGMGMRPSPVSPVSTSQSNSRGLAKVGRPRKRLASTVAATAPPDSKKAPEQPLPPLNSTTTRYGRVVRSQKPVADNSAGQSGQELMAELRDKDYRGSAQRELLERPAPASASRSVPQNAICPGCGKIFLGRRLQRHFVKFPEHMQAVAAPAAEPTTTTLFGLMTAQLQRHSHLSEEQRADLFLHELNDFVEQLQLRSTRLIRNTSGQHFVNGRCARILGIPEGQYALDMSAMESAQAPAPEPEEEQEAEPRLLHAGAVAGAPNLVDYAGLSMSLDDTLTDEAAQRLNLSAGGKLLPPSEESLLRNVGDLMQPPVAVNVTSVASTGGGHAHDHVAEVGVLPHYDHASDNAVEALSMKETPNAAILDLNVDFFQFNNN